MKTIPQVRDDLMALAYEISVTEDTENNAKFARKLKTLVSHMHRRKAIRRADRKSRPLTQITANKIRAYATNHALLSYKEIANKFDVAISSVSKAIAGER